MFFERFGKRLGRFSVNDDARRGRVLPVLRLLRLDRLKNSHGRIRPRGAVPGLQGVPLERLEDVFGRPRHVSYVGPNDAEPVVEGVDVGGVVASGGKKSTLMFSFEKK